MTKRYICAILALFLLLSCFAAGCQKNTTETSAEAEVETVHGKTVGEIIGTSVDENEDDGAEADADPIYFNGIAYVPKADVNSYLFMGIDHDTAGETALANAGGQADAIFLIVLDNENKTYTVLQLNRDTICEVDTMGLGNVILNSADMQLCLSHTYGDGDEASDENTVRAVSRLLYDTTIDGYMAVGMDAMPVLNDAVGGVTVTLTEDFSEFDSAMTQGTTLTLTGDQAYIYLRKRMEIGDGTNLSRMERHRTYLTAFMEKLQEEMAEDSSVLNTVYDSVESYAQTNISGADLSKLFLAASEYEGQGIVTPEGTTAVVNGLNEFYVDEDNLTEIILSLYYNKVSD